MMAHLQRSGLIRRKTRYLKAIMAGWRAARAGWQAAREKYSQHYPEHGRSTTARKASGGTFSRYLKRRDGQSLIRPLNSTTMPHEQFEKYERELLAALNVEEQPETRNIAISGAIGVGKSAFVHAFTERNPQFKYTRIFLPPLSEINPPITGDSNENEKELLEQLLCSITGKLPDDIKALQHKPKGWKKVIGALLALSTSYSIATLGYLSGSLGIDQSTTVKALHLYLPDPMLAFAKKYAPLLAELSLFLVGTLVVLYLFTGLLKTGQRKRRTRLENRADRSDVSHYLHQINHAFNHGRYDVVIVENLTSPSQQTALETLYCVNGYLNGSGHIKQPVYFIYLLADEILTASERTRFFDLVVPIIPAPNAEHTGPELYKRLKTINSRGMDKALIYNVASAIGDMKLMTNIVNEFHIYLDQLSTDFKAPNNNKLFAMVVIKNLYPKEHAELTDGMGLFWTVFHDNKLPGKTVAETLRQGFMADSVLRALTEERFGPLLYLLMNGYFAEDYRDYLFYFYPDTPFNGYPIASWQPATPLPQSLEHQASNFSQKSTNQNSGEYLNGYLPNDFQVATQWQVSEALEVWQHRELEAKEYSLPDSNEIHDATLNQLLSAFTDFYLEQLNLTHLSPSRIEIIIQHPKCRFSLKSLEWLAKSDNQFKTDTTYYYLLRFWNEYKTNAVSTAQLTVNTIVKLLSGSEINIDDKLWLCNLLNHENEIDSRILAAMLAPITSQPAESFTMKIRFGRLEMLMATARTLPEKIRLLSQQVKYLSRQEVLTLLSQLDIDGTGQLMKENNHFSLSGTQENIELINAFK
ncbi:hypothetical protein [Endozoicomonas sp. ALC013]|uniref:YobI family P-loop NTPase n=1 Tax=Endozoicomonas sp. ALC013 TaxID=3403076 RepID=UPI003BB4E6DD